MFLFGDKVVSGMVGNNPTIPTNVSVNDNIPFQYDFRSVYSSVLEKWFCVPPTTLQTILMKNFQSLNIINGTPTCKSTDPGNQNAGDKLIWNYPNPFVDSTTIEFKTKGGHTLVQIIDMLGRVMRTLVDQDYQAGTYKVTFDSSGLPSGVYYARFQNGPDQQVRAMLKVRG